MTSNGRIRKQPKPWQCEYCGAKHEAGESAHVRWEDRPHPLPPRQILSCPVHG
jgi:hypothetical protein